MPIPDLLLRLLEAVGPSGHEEAAAQVWRDAASEFAEVHSDTLGSSYARVRAGEGSPTLAIVGHIDEIGVAITTIEDSGLLAYTMLGGINPEVLVGQRLRIRGRGGDVVGVVGRKRLSAEQIRDRPKLEHGDLHIDIGATSREDAEKYVRVGDAGVWEGAPAELPNNRFCSRALDNRLGAYVALESARRIAEAKDAQVDVVAVAAVQEEIGLYGARVAAFGLDPQVALAIDVTPATDVPGGNPRTAGRIELGMGAMIARGPTVNRHVDELLARAAEEEGIPHAFEIYSRTTSTDADEIHLSRAGIPTGLVSVPTRYVHSPTETASLEDVEAVVRLVVAFARRLTREHDFTR